jgi:hypothetical protein
VHFSSNTLSKAAQIAEQIESLENQLSVLLQGGDSIAEKQSTPKAAPNRRIASPKKADSAPSKAVEEGKVLGIRLHKMLGVQPLGGGLFKAK